jgi:uncharacterized protein YabE (DUF348 family)
MKHLHGFALAILFLVTACQPTESSVTIIDGKNIRTLSAGQTSERMSQTLLAQAGITLQPNERILMNGIPFPVDQALPQADSIQLQVRHAVTLTLVTPQGQGTFDTSALTVGEALQEAGVNLSVNDFLDPPAETPITQSLTVTYNPARELVISVGGKTLKVFSAKQTVGEALTEAGIPLVGADYSTPAESDALPADGNIRVVRVYETVKIKLEEIPFEIEKIEDASLPMGQEEVVQPGVKGIVMVRTRIRYEDDVEVNRVKEDKVVMREPQKKIARSGSKIVLANINGLDYWLATEMYATVYSPCASGTGSCSYGTASGARAGYGIVAVDTSAYPYLAGTRVYIPGYGTATIGDTGGGSLIESRYGIPRTKWLDLGFDDGKIINMTGWVTVYFLAPAPAEIPYFLK